MFGKIASLIAKPLINTVSGLTSSFSSSKVSGFQNPYNAPSNSFCATPLANQLPLGDILSGFANRICDAFEKLTNTIQNLFSDLTQPQPTEVNPEKKEGGFFENLLGKLGGSGLGKIVSTVGSLFGGAPLKAVSLISKLF